MGLLEEWRAADSVFVYNEAWSTATVALSLTYISGSSPCVRACSCFSCVVNYLQQRLSPLRGTCSGNRVTQLKNCAGEMQGESNHCIAVIGDGAITGGMAYEALNHAGFVSKNLIVILNDNEQVGILWAPE